MQLEAALAQGSNIVCPPLPTVENLPHSSFACSFVLIVSVLFVVSFVFVAIALLASGEVECHHSLSLICLYLPSYPTDYLEKRPHLS